MPLLYEGMPLSEVRIDWRTKIVAWWDGFDLDAIRQKQEQQRARLLEAKRDMSKQKDTPLPLPVEEPEIENGLDRHGRALWSLTRIELAELMWGEGYVEPGATSWIPKLIATLPLNRDSSLLDLSAGLGGVSRHAIEQYGTYVDAYEQSPLLVEEAGKRLKSIPDQSHINLDEFSLERFGITRRYEFCVALNVFYTIADKPLLWQHLSSVLKDRGQLVFTDFVIDGDTDLTAKPMRAWQDTERLEPHLQTIGETEKQLTSAGFDVRTVEDLSTAYKRETKLGLSRLHDYLLAKDLDQDSKTILTDEIALLTRRLLALENGLRVKRVHAILPISAGESDDLTE